MATEPFRLWLGKEIRNKWAQATAAECEPLTFSDLQKGDRFISMPLPGDNSGHDGLLGGHHLFVKIGLTACGDLSAKNTVRISDGALFYLKNDLFVIKVD